MQTDTKLPTVKEIALERRSLDLSKAEFGRRLGYAPSYVASLENGHLPVTRRFAARVWSLQEEIRGDLRVVEILAPTEFGDFEGAILLTRPKICACGCEARFIPRAWNHRYLSRKHRRRKRSTAEP